MCEAGAEKLHRLGTVQFVTVFSMFARGRPFGRHRSWPLAFFPLRLPAECYSPTQANSSVAPVPAETSRAGRNRALETKSMEDGDDPFRRRNEPVARPTDRAAETTTAALSRNRVGEEQPWPASERRWGECPNYAALDLGTNNCRLLVARPSRRGFHVIDAFSRIIRLGEGLGATGRLSDAAMERTRDALRICAGKIARNRVHRARLVATEACRVASNGEAFLQRVGGELGLDIEILTREDEARLAVSGSASLLDPSCDLALVFDIGGGSSELVWLDLRRRQSWRRNVVDRVEAQRCIFAWTSLPVGVVSLAEQFGGRFVDAPLYEEMVAHVVGLIEPFEQTHAVRRRLQHARVHLLGTSGTVTTIAGVHMRLPRYDRNRVDGCWLSTSDMRRVTDDLLAASHEQRVAEPCIGRDRADLVLAGCAILEALLRVWPCERLRVADRGLREGILASLMAEDGHPRGGWNR
jgi:exopolyphosphatase/guanosine-5'-triphosphate,3'-diphosphate pyrophosphatase